MHPSVERLQHIPPRLQRAIIPHNAPPIPIYFHQVPQSVIQSIRGSLTTVPIWPADAPVDPDGRRSWRMVYRDEFTIYIRSMSVPDDPPGVWALSPLQEEIFIPQSLLDFEVIDPEPLRPSIPPPSTMAGSRHEPTLMTCLHDHTFCGRRCKVCGSQNTHDIYCPSIHPGFFCKWCNLGNGVHELGCSGFIRQQPRRQHARRNWDDT